MPAGLAGKRGYWGAMTSSTVAFVLLSLGILVFFPLWLSADYLPGVVVMPLSLGLSGIALLNVRRRNNTAQLDKARAAWLMQLCFGALTIVAVPVLAFEAYQQTNALVGSFAIALPLTIYLGLEVERFRASKQRRAAAAFLDPFYEPLLQTPTGSHRLQGVALSRGPLAEPQGAGEAASTGRTAQEPMPPDAQADSAQPDQQTEPLKARQTTSTRSTEEILADLDGMIALDEVKAQVRDWIAQQRIQLQRRRAGEPEDTHDYTLILKGPPGTGKSTVAAYLGELFCALGLLPSGHLITATRADLIGKYQGHSANEMRELLHKALGGVLFIDEVHSLIVGDDGGDTFGREIVTTIVGFIEQHRGQLAVIIAGYGDEVDEFLTKDPGLKSRFLYSIEHQAYTTDELVAITDYELNKSKRLLTPEAHTRMEATWEELMNDPSRDPHTWGNGREARKLTKYMERLQARRLDALGEELSSEQLRTVTLQDLEGGYELYCAGD